jgi:hypothetical protein
MWEATGIALPLPRAGEVLWESDLLLASMVALVPRRSLLIAGDWDEARDWEQDPRRATSLTALLGQVSRPSKRRLTRRTTCRFHCRSSSPISARIDLALLAHAAPEFVGRSESVSTSWLEAM